MSLLEINRTILSNQVDKLTADQVEGALAVAQGESNLERRRLALACELSDRWPMSICSEIAEALLPGPANGPPG
jgi:hypothetical protein